MSEKQGVHSNNHELDLNSSFKNEEIMRGNFLLSRVDSSSKKLVDDTNLYEEEKIDKIIIIAPSTQNIT